jgi:FtsP/CotA-like multicopper oxidase with cupredoxin domain
LEGHTLNPIARDGIPLWRMGLTVPRKPDRPTDYPNAMLMAPGQRIDVLVQAGKSGTYAFRAVPHDQGCASPTGPIARLVIEGDPLPMNLPAKLSTPPEKLIGDEEITGTRVLTFSAMEPGTQEWQKFRFTIDGKIFDPDRVDQRVRLGAVEAWTIVNETTDDRSRLPPMSTICC